MMYFMIMSWIHLAEINAEVECAFPDVSEVGLSSTHKDYPSS